MTVPSRYTTTQLPQGLLGALLDGLSVAVLVAGGSPRRVVYANPRARRIMDVDRYRLLGLHLDDLRTLLDARPCTTGHGGRWKGTVKGPDGTTRSITLDMSHRRNLTVMELTYETRQVTRDGES